MTAPRFFITATGTEQGKTLVTTSLCWQLRQAGYRVNALKPVISGFEEVQNSDTGLILQSLGLPLSETQIDATSPWRFYEPLSPDYAAELEGKKLELETIIAFCNQSPRQDIQLIEGAGGLMSPLSRQHTNLDLIKGLDCPALLVTAAYLGCISHTLTALAVMRKADIPVSGLILCELPEQGQQAETVLHSLQPQLPMDLPLKVIKALEGKRELWKTAPHIADLVSVHV